MRQMYRSKTRLIYRYLALMVVCRFAILPLEAQLPQRTATDALQHGLHLADLYDWSDAAKDFSDAEQMFIVAGDQRNVLYARLGKIRSTIEDRSLPATAAELDSELNTNPQLQTDRQLRMFCLIIKGDIDGELNSSAMRRDWEQVQALASQLGDKKWQNRALAQLGFASFYDGDLQAATRNVSAALIEATSSGDAGARIRFMSAVGLGFMQSKLYQQALTSLDNSLKLASTTPDAGYQFLAIEGKVETLIGLRQLDAAGQLAAEALNRARRDGRPGHEAALLILSSKLALAQHDENSALSALERSLAVARTTGLRRQLADAQSELADIYRNKGDLIQAEHFAELAAASIQESGNAWAVPQRLGALAELQISRGQYTAADRVFDRAEAFVDGMIGNYSGIFEKTALIRASSELYARHFSLIAEHFRDPARAYAVVEQVRGRVLTDLLRAGATTSDQARRNEHTLSELRLRLMETHSGSEMRRLRDQISLAEQARWVAPGVSILKSHSQERVELSTIQRSLTPSALLLEYVLADPKSYCLVVSRNEARVVTLGSKRQLEALAAEYLNAVKGKQTAETVSRQLYDALLRPIGGIGQGRTLVIVRDGRLHLLPFDALLDDAGRYVAQTDTVVYAPSASSLYLLATEEQSRARRRPLLAVGAVPYGSEEMKRANVTRGYNAKGLADLPASRDEVMAAAAALRSTANTLLLGQAATESSFKNARLEDYKLVHLAVHGLADQNDSDRAALFLLSDPAAGEDGILHASEIVQMRFGADAVVLSACDTAVGPVQGEEGIATLSKAFLLAGARTVISTLWSIDDTFALFLMKQFYKHLGSQETPANALAAAKRDMLHKFGAKAVPYYWAAFTCEGAADQAFIYNHEKERAAHATRPAAAYQYLRVR